MIWTESVDRTCSSSAFGAQSTSFAAISSTASNASKSASNHPDKYCPFSNVQISQAYWQATSQVLALLNSLYVPKCEVTFLDGGVPNASSFLQFPDDNDQNISFKSQLNLVDSNATEVLQMNDSDRGSKQW